MAGNSPSTELFRFVTVRNPQSATPSTTSTRFFRYDPGRFAQGKSRGSDLYQKLIKVRGSGENAREAMEAVAWEFRKTDRAIVSQADLAANISIFLPLLEWISQDRSDKIDAGKLRSLVESMIGGKLDRYLADEKLIQYWSRIWDNLFAHAISPTDDSLGQQLVHALQVIHVLETVLGAPRDGVLDQYALRPKPELPSEVFPLPQRSSPASKEVRATPSNPQVIVRVGDSFIEKDRLCSGRVPIEPCTPYDGPALLANAPALKPVGVGDLILVRSTLKRYELGEISHIMNVMQTEKMERTHRTLFRVEDTVMSETESTSEIQRDTQTTERFSLESEAKAEATKATQFQAGVSTSGQYGTTQVQANASVAGQFSQSDSAQTSKKYAKETTDRAVSKVTERVKQVRSKTTISESEETNLHAYDNTKGADHVVGLYRWVDKVYEAQLVNYGKRLFFQFLIQEPAAFFIYAAANKKTEGATLRRPTDPSQGRTGLAPLRSPLDVTRANYGFWAAELGIDDISAPQASEVTASMNKSGGSDPQYYEFSDSITIPQDYRAKSISVFAQSGGDGTYMDVNVAGRYFWHTPTPVEDALMKGETLSIPVGVRGYNSNWAITITIKCELIPEVHEKWQVKTFNSIMSAYRQQMDEYNATIRSAASGLGYGGTTKRDSEKRSAERAELKKACIEVFSGQKFEAFDAVRNRQPVAGYPEFDDAEMEAQGRFIQYHENAFEWDSMTYEFYDYFWGRKPYWVDAMQLEDSDPTFAAFLRAGAARVLLPVRPGFEASVMYYIASGGQIWSGTQDLPLLGDPMWVAIADDLIAQAPSSDGVLIGDPWEAKVPTTLVALESASLKLPQF